MKSHTEYEYEHFIYTTKNKNITFMLIQTE